MEGGVNVIHRLIRGKRPRRLVGAFLALVVVVSIVLVVGPASRGAAKTAPKPKQVEIVGPNGTPVNVVNGSIATQLAPLASPLHFQTLLHLNAGNTQVVSILPPIPRTTTVSISSITLTCNVCTGGSGASQSVDMALNGENSPDCSTQAFPVAELLASGAEPTDEFTYPTPRIAPAGFTPTGQWCLQAVFFAAGAAVNAMLTIDGSQG